jgi:hypothetical protein
MATAKASRQKAAPLPPPPGPAELVYGEDPLTGALTEEPAAVRGAVSVPIADIPEYLEAYGLVPDKSLPGGPLQNLPGLGWTLWVRRVGEEAQER